MLNVCVCSVWVKSYLRSCVWMRDCTYALTPLRHLCVCRPDRWMRDCKEKDTREAHMRLLSLITRKRDKNHHTVSKMIDFLHKYTCMQTHTTSTPTVKHSLFPFKHFSCVSNRSCVPNPSIQIYESFNEIKRVNISLFQDKHEQLKGTKQKMQWTCTEGLE